jgi:uncharacterized protein VirK/YbjX
MKSSPWQAFKLAFQLTQRFSPHRDFSSRLGRGLSASLKFRDYWGWYTFITRPEFAVVREHDSLLWFKGLRGYMSRHWSTSRAYKVLRDTYQYGLEQPGLLQRALLGGEKVSILEIPIDDEVGNLKLILSHDPLFKREGEWSLTLNCSQLGGDIVSLGFAVEKIQGDWILYIGAIQHHGGVTPDHIKTACRVLHGVRAKSLLIYCLEEMARNLGFKRILGASNEIHMSHRKHFINVPWNRITFDYNQTWLDVHGVKAEDGWYEIPLRNPRRQPSEIKANKRSMYKRRYAFLDQLDQSMEKALKPSSGLLEVKPTLV